MAEFQSFQKEEGFQPVDVPDITPYINENLEALRQSERQNVKDKYVVDKARADELGKSFQAIASLGSKTAEFFQGREKAYRQKETALMEQEEYQRYLADPEGYVRQGFSAEVQDIRELNKQTEDLGSKAYEQTGNHEVARQVRELSGWREIAQARIQLKLANDYYQSWLPKQLLGADITDQASRGAAIAQARSAFVKEFGLMSFSDDMLGTVLYPEMTKLHAKLMKEGAALDAQNATFETVAEATTLFDQDNDFASLVNTLSNTLDEKGQVLGRGRGFDKAIQHLKKMFKAGTISADELEAIENQPMPGMGGRTYGELKGTAFENLMQEQAAEERANNDARRKDREEEQKVMVDEYVEKVASGEVIPSKADLTALQDQYRMATGKEDYRLNALMKDTASARTEREANIQFENYARAGILTPEMVLRIPSTAIHQKWLKVAQNLQAARKAGVKDHHKALEELVKTTPGLKATVDGVRGFESVMIISELKGEFDRRLAELVQNDNGQTPPAQLATQALAEARQSFTEGLNNPTSIYHFSTNGSDPNNPPGFINYRRGLQQRATVEEKSLARNRLTNTTEMIKSYGSDIVDVPGAVLTRGEFEQMDKDLQKNGFKMPGIVTYIAGQTGFTPLEVIERARKAMDLPPMPVPPSLQYVDNTLSPTARALLYKHQTPQRSIRGFAETREYEPAIVPGGFGPKIQEEAAKNDIPPAVLTALLEQESGFRPDVISGKTLSRSGAAGIAQFMPGTAQQFGVDPLDTDSAIAGAATYLRHLMDNYGFDLKTAIYAYNAGPATVQKYGIGATEENANYYPSIMALATKYGYGQISLNDPATLRPSFSGN